MTITTGMAENRSEQSRLRSIPISSNVETLSCIAGGGALIALGLARRSWIGWVLAATGGGLVLNALANERRPYQGTVRIGVTIRRSPEEIYEFICDPENQAKFLEGLELRANPDRSATVVFGRPAGFMLESDAQITDEQPGEYIAWSATPESVQEHSLDHRGVIHFRRAPADRGTEVAVALDLKAPIGPIGRALASFVGWGPEQIVRESLRRLKQLMEAGEIPTTAGQSSGARGLKGSALRVLYRERNFEQPGENRLAGD